MNIYISWTIKSTLVVDEVRRTLWTCAIIAKKQVFGEKTSGEKQSFELFCRGQRSAGQRFAGVATLTKKPEDSGYEIVSRK